MKKYSPLRKATVAVMVTVALTLSAVGISHYIAPIQSAAASAPKASAAAASQAAESQAHALQTLNSFYKPALKGQFPKLPGLTLGTSTRQDVVKAIGKPEVPGKDSDAFDVYGAEMGNPGYAISYKLNKIREMRYFGTNVERQTNIGGITLKMLVQQWGAPKSSTLFSTGKIKQKKVVYIRGDYKLEFIFNDNTHLDHINLTK
ncbi:YjgB family protein [Cohnella lupini]|uniref:Uncharacterized protein DUF4309 n=1 Tax=Cohnella lupini TaxID=1294267 RepID=A0A3D9IBW8_9BACL|nr:YjgB family protein [Cohnella lupini]RED59262.1 uncharacterized protein DUF4309 [Cohnella lupini]